MMKFVLLASAFTAFAVAAPAHAYCDSYGHCTGPSANHWNRWQQRTDPGYNGAVYRNGRYYYPYGYEYGYDGYGGFPLIACLFVRCRPNAVKDNTAKLDGRYYKNCGNDPAVPVDQGCAGTQPTYAAAGGSQQVPEGAIVESYNDSNGNFVTVRIINGQRVAMVERAR